MPVGCSEVGQLKAMWPRWSESFREEQTGRPWGDNDTGELGGGGLVFGIFPSSFILACLPHLFA